jgi:hypothetical protein
VNQCQFVTLCNSGSGVCVHGGVVLANHAISADFSGSDSTGASWSGHATATYNSLGQIASYTVTINGQTCRG